MDAIPGSREGRVNVDYGKPSDNDVENKVVGQLQPAIVMALRLGLGKGVLGYAEAETLEEAQQAADKLAEVEKTRRQATKTPAQ